MTEQKSKLAMHLTYIASISCYNNGKSPKDAWRNRGEHYFAVGLYEGGPTLQACLDTVQGLRSSEYGQQYAYLEVEIFSQCATCRSVGTITGKRKSRLCPACKGKRQEMKELSIRL